MRSKYSFVKVSLHSHDKVDPGMVSAKSTSVRESQTYRWRYEVTIMLNAPLILDVQTIATYITTLMAPLLSHDIHSVLICHHDSLVEAQRITVERLALTSHLLTLPEIPTSLYLLLPILEIIRHPYQLLVPTVVETEFPLFWWSVIWT